MSRDNGNSELPMKSISFSVSLQQWLVDLIDDENLKLAADNRSFIISQALKEYFERKAEQCILSDAKRLPWWKQVYTILRRESCE